MPTAYCMKCRQKREIKDPKQVTLKNGRPVTQGVCPVCGTKLFRMASFRSSRAMRQALLGSPLGAFIAASALPVVVA